MTLSSPLLPSTHPPASVGTLLRLARRLHVLCGKADREDGASSIRLQHQIMQLSLQLDQSYSAALKAGARLGQAYLITARSGQCYLLTLTTEGVTYQPAAEVTLAQVA